MDCHSTQVTLLFYARPEAANSLISPIVTLDSGSGAHTCGFTEQMANANANCTGYGSGGLGLDDDGYDYDRAVRTPPIAFELVRTPLIAFSNAPLLAF